MPRIEKTRTVKIALLVLRVYLGGLALLLVLKLLHVFG